MTAPSPNAVFAALHAETGGRLFTVTVLNREAGLAQRVYTSHPKDYPVSGTKPMGQGEWTNIVIERGEVFVANTTPEFAIYFADHELIESLGCQSALNIPVGEDLVLGTVNILDVSNTNNPLISIITDKLLQAGFKAPLIVKGNAQAQQAATGFAV